MSPKPAHIFVMYTLQPRGAVRFIDWLDLKCGVLRKRSLHVSPSKEEDKESREQQVDGEAGYGHATIISTYVAKND